MHKKLIVAFAMVCFLQIGNLQAQLRKIPSAVTAAFAEKYPQVKDVEWKDKLTNFQATFSDEEHTTTVKFNSDGQWKSTETTIDLDEVPNDVKKAFAQSKYADWKITNTSKVLELGKILQYKLTVAGESIIERKNLFYTAKGQLVKSAQSI